MKIVFLGDSITDGGRDFRNYHNLGNGYPKYAAQYISEAHPETDFEFINFGIGGNRTSQLFDRLYNDCIEFEPDVVSLLIGINDLIHRHLSTRILTTDVQIELNYRTILERLKTETKAKIVMMVPYYLDADEKPYLREELKTLQPIVRRLADEYADVCIHLDVEFAKVLMTQPAPRYYSVDGVHPNEEGAKFIGRLYADAVEPLLK